MKSSKKARDNLIGYMVKMFKKYSEDYENDLNELSNIKSLGNNFFVKENVPKYILKNILKLDQFNALSEVNKKIILGLINLNHFPALRNIIVQIRINVLRMDSILYYAHDNDLELIKHYIEDQKIANLSMIQYKQDPSIIDGFVLKNSKQTFDCSVASQIRILRETLKFN